VSRRGDEWLADVLDAIEAARQDDLAGYAAPGSIGTVGMSPIYQSLGTKEEKRHGEERVAEKQVSFSADRRENRGARRLAGQDA
jgi:hypothetical protein